MQITAHRGWRPVPRGILVACLAAALTERAIPESRSAVAHDFEITLLSSRPDTVTAGDALVRIDVPRVVPMDKVIVRRNGVDVTGRLIRDDVARTFVGIVDGLDLGENTLRVESNGEGEGRPTASLTLVNHPKEGPVFSGPRQTPFACETGSFKFPVLATSPLGPSTPPDCSATAPVVGYFYRTSAGAFAPFIPDDRGMYTYPSDLAFTTTTLGRTVPYIVRMEVGTANRGIYEISFLHDPIADPAPTFLQRSPGWNGRIIYGFGTGCNGGWYRQGVAFVLVSETAPQTLLPGVDFLYANGYASVSSTLNNNSNNCNDVIAAETAMMVKERFIETYGVPDATIGFGLSGGAMQQYSIADNYPGIVDGIVPGGSFADALFAFSDVNQDAYLLDSYFKRSTLAWTTEQKRSVTGFAQYATATAANVAPLGKNLDPRVFCPPTLPKADQWNPGNPGGVRCDIFSAFVDVFGRNEEGRARRAVDNVGVQYGLAALNLDEGNLGHISKEQFLDLNERVGGFNDDGDIVAERTEGDETAIETAYQTGRLTNGGLGLAAIPIIDYRAYSEGDAHQRFHSFTMRERLLAANGRADNQVMVIEDLRNGLYSPIRSQLLADSFLKMDRWITAIRADTSGGDPIAKVVRNKPPDLQEGCMTRDPIATFVPEQQDAGTSTTCGALYPTHSYPRGVAGERTRHDVIKCRLKAIADSDYTKVTFTDAEKERLAAIFPEGVCDYTAQGVGQQRPVGAWIDYGPSGDEAR